MNNILLLTDSYKISHWKQYPPKTTNVYSYFESRGGQFKKTMFFGLQYILEKYLSKPITKEDILEAEVLYKQHFGDWLFNHEGWHHILNKHGGYLPVRIKAVPEGTIVPTGNVLMTIENTDPEVPWLTNFLETLLSQVWYPSTVATLSYHTRQLILKYLKETGDPSLIDFKLHDFGFRGSTTVEAAGIGGAAHLVNFLGTDTVPAMTLLRDHYSSEFAAGFSVPASEHSTITAWGKENEVGAYRNMIEQYGDSPFYACVSDSYDIYNACRDLWGNKLWNEVMEAKGTLVVRPDSGIPSIIVPQILTLLGEKFGTHVNDKGYRVLNPKVRVIQGDGMDYASIDQTLNSMKEQGWSTDNVTFGMGGGLLQKINRDTQKFAFKCSFVIVDGKPRDVYKEPVTDEGKVSKKGRLGLKRVGNKFVTTTEWNNEVLETVFVNGKIVKKSNLKEIRERAGTIVE